MVAGADSISNFELGHELVKGDMLTRNAWEKLRWRHVDWESIPPDSRVLVVTFLSVEDNLLGLNQALTTKKDKLRKELKKSYKRAVIPAFGTYRSTDENNFAGLRWVMKMGIDLQSITLSF